MSRGYSHEQTHRFDGEGFIRSQGVRVAGDPGLPLPRTLLHRLRGW